MLRDTQTGGTAGGVPKSGKAPDDSVRLVLQAEVSIASN